MLSCRLEALLGKSDSDSGSDDEKKEDENKDIPLNQNTVLGNSKFLTDKDRLKRQGGALLKMPFEVQSKYVCGCIPSTIVLCYIMMIRTFTRTSYLLPLDTMIKFYHVLSPKKAFWCHSCIIPASLIFRIVCAALCITPLVCVVLVKVSVTSYFTVHQTVSPYGSFSGDITLSSNGLILLAFICDIKEVGVAASLCWSSTSAVSCFLWPLLRYLSCDLYNFE